VPRTARLRPRASTSFAPGGEREPQQEQQLQDEEEESFWDSVPVPLEELEGGWKDKEPEAFLAVLLTAVLVGSLARAARSLGSACVLMRPRQALAAGRILIVLTAVFFAAVKYGVVALLLVLLGIFFLNRQRD